MPTSGARSTHPGRLLEAVPIAALPHPPAFRPALYRSAPQVSQTKPNLPVSSASRPPTPPVSRPMPFVTQARLSSVANPVPRPSAPPVYRSQQLVSQTKANLVSVISGRSAPLPANHGELRNWQAKPGALCLPARGDLPPARAPQSSICQTKSDPSVRTADRPPAPPVYRPVSATSAAPAVDQPSVAVPRKVRGALDRKSVV